MLLAIDVGNTRINCGLFEGKRLKKKWTQSVNEKIKIKYKNVNSIVLSSVVPKITKKIKGSFNVPVLEVNSRLELGLKIRYRNPRKVGADRLANAVAAKKLYGVPALVIDFGTATTIDVLAAKKGDYLGGVIMPGVDMARKGLKNNTALLPLVQLDRPKRILGRNTNSAIQAGLYYGFCGMIEKVVLGLKKELHLPSKTVIIATGGGAKFFAKELGVKVDSDLTLKGLRLIYERQKNS